MVQKVEIVGDLVKVYEETLQYEANLHDIIPHMETRVPVTLPILPDRTRAIYWDESNPLDKRLDLLIQIDPAVRTIQYNRDPTTVSMPYTIFAFRIRTATENPRGRDWDLGDMQVFFSREPITSIDQDMIPAILPNIYHDGRICFGNTGVNVNQPLHDRVNQLVNDFYLTGFTNHHVRDYQWPWAKTSPQKWVSETELSRGCWHDFPEWDADNPHVTHFTVNTVFTHPPDHNIPMMVLDAIPPMPDLPTFGRTEEWLRGINNAQRLRLETGLQALRAEAADLFTPPPPPPPEEVV